MKEQAKSSERYDEVGAIMAYEQGDLDFDGIVELFRRLKASGTVYHLQGHYQRALAALEAQGIV